MNWRNTGILFLVLLVPVILILIFKTGTTNLVNLPVFGDKVLVNGDSADYTVDLSKLFDSYNQYNDYHLLLYFGENESGSLNQEAIENLSLISRRLESAKSHPKNPVNDVLLLSVSNDSFEQERNTIWKQITTDKSISEFIKTQLSNGFGQSENPIKDQMAFLLDKDRRVRALYFTAHGKFDRELFGELVVLKNEYGEPANN